MRVEEEYEKQRELLGKERSDQKESVRRTGAEWKKELQAAE